MRALTILWYERSCNIAVLHDSVAPRTIRVGNRLTIGSAQTVRSNQ